MSTLYELLSNSEEERESQVEFFKTVDISLPGYYHADQTDLKILVECLNVYQETGINYFKRYETFMNSIHYCQLEKGIKGFCKSTKGTIYENRDTIEMFKKEAEHRIKDMEFFGFSHVNNFTKDDYKVLLMNCEEEYYKMIAEKNRNKIKEKETEMKELVENYLNFEAFDINTLEQHFKQCIKELINKTYVENDLLNTVRPTKVKDIYLIVMFSNNVAVKIGRTRNIVQWVATNNKEYENTTFGLYSVDEEYIAELIVKVCIYFDTILTNAGMVKVSNKMYANLNQAKKVYAHLYGITLPRLRKIISLNGITQRQIGSITVLEKAELDKHVRRYLKLNTN
ncbi:hypothetical protein GMB34_00640 [Turicibacter sanguinis]|nr:hypothetical protein [Turicibacter sanguinis]MTN82663.1 hypothetical protein [Turicibacter sanguinis]MTN85659.1 hypothetical protein [Turicibacter sanguinis]MTN88394.1 hypothetical protein [Turicibacter sanguinis]MTN93974.1 hypothetical protein [Turicibacter sanguinis]